MLSLVFIASFSSFLRADTTPVYILKTAPRLVRSTALDVCAYLKQMTKEETPFKEVTLTGIPDGPGIIIGIADDTAVQRRLIGDGYVMKTKGAKIYLYGKTPKATALAAYSFLEKLGCRWWSYNEEYIPELTTLPNLVLDEVYSTFKQSWIMSNENQSGTNQFSFKVGGRSTETFTGNHTIQPMLKAYAKKHPEIYPLVKGKRVFNNLHYCYTAPGIIEALSAALEKEIVKRKGNVDDYIYFAGMGDWYGGMCECHRCSKIYKDETWINPDGKKLVGYSATLLQMINGVAKNLEIKHPGIQIGTFAYMSLENPPAHTKPRKNVVIQMPHLRHCTAHPVEECDKNRRFKHSLERWSNIAPGRVYIWDYVVNYGGNFMYPFPVLRATAKNIAYYNKIGCAGVMLQGNYVSTGSDLVVLKNYIWRKLFWDPQLKMEDLLAEFCDGYYGPASKHIQEYVLLLEDAIGPKTHFDEFVKIEKLKETVLRDELLAKARGLLHSALVATQNDEIYSRRVKEVKVSIDSMVLLQKKKRLISKGQEGLLVNGEYVYADLVKLLSHSRKASPREWGRYMSYHQSYKIKNGGPITTLISNNITLDIASIQAGRIFQIQYNNQDLLRSIQKTPKGLNMRGSFEILSAPARLYDIVDKKDGVVSMQADSGLGLWATPKAKAHKAISLKENTIRIVGASEEIRSHKNEQARCVTDYVIEPGAMINLSFFKDDRWVAFDVNVLLDNKENIENLKTDTPLKYTITGVNKMRLTFPKRKCVLTDSYLAPATKEINIYFDYSNGVLTTEVVMDRVVNKVRMAKRPGAMWLERELEIVGLPSR